jgi:hypothetical protein
MGYKPVIELDAFETTSSPEPPKPPELEVVPPSDPPDVSAMNHEDAIEAMVGWFFENFEDPAHSTPWDGGYVYIWGGPYDATGEIYDAFDEKTCEYAIREAIKQIEDSGWEWVPAENRIQPVNPTGVVEHDKGLLGC